MPPSGLRQKQALSKDPISTSRFLLKTRASIFSLDVCRENDPEGEPSGMLQSLDGCSFKQPKPLKSHPSECVIGTEGFAHVSAGHS